MGKMVPFRRDRPPPNRFAPRDPERAQRVPGHLERAFGQFGRGATNGSRDADDGALMYFPIENQWGKFWDLKKNLFPKKKVFGAQIPAVRNF